MGNKTIARLSMILTFTCIALIGLKLFNIVTFSWWWVFAPIYSPLVLAVTWLSISFTIGSIYYYIKRK